MIAEKSLSKGWSLPAVLDKVLRGSLVAYGIISLLLIIPSFYFTSVRKHAIGGEFEARYNEVSSIVNGVDPFKIWTGDVKSDLYYPYDKPELKAEGKTWIHAYTPWSYSYLMPLVLAFDKESAWNAYSVILLLSLALIIALAYQQGRFACSSGADGIRCSAISMAMGLTASCSVIIGNYSILIALAILLMMLALNKGHDIMAGICWAVAMTKPQDAMLLAIPLLIHRKWRVFFVAVGTCLIAVMPPAVLSHTSPVELIIEATQLRATGLGADTSPLLTPFIPFLRRLDCANALAGPLFIFNALFGVALCAVMCWRARRETNWLFILSPAVVCAPVWCYMTYIDRCIFFVVLLAAFVFYVSAADERRRRIALMCLCSVSLTGVSSLAFCFGKLQSLFSCWGVCITERQLAYVIACVDFPLVVFMVASSFLLFSTHESHETT